MALLARIVMLAAVSQGPVTLPEGGRVLLELTSDRDIYHMGEAVELTLTARNVGEKPLFGYFLLEPYLPPDLKSSMLLYCREGIPPCAEFLGSIPNIQYMDMAVAPIRLAPGQHQASRFVVARNPQSKQMVLDTAGEHEFRWVTWGVHERPGQGPKVQGQELSASTVLRVLPVPVSEQSAYDYYVQHNLADMAQYDEAYFRYRDEVRLAAHTMLTRFPDSIYADAVRIGFKKLLESRVRRGRATDEDRAALDNLRARLANGRN